MSTHAEPEIRRLRFIGAMLDIPRSVVAIAPIWIVADIFARFTPHSAARFSTAAWWLTCVLLSLVVYRQVSRYRIASPDHRFFRDERRVAAWLDKIRAEKAVRIGIPSELVVLKTINFALLFVRWGLFLAIMIGGFRYIWTSLAGNQTFPEPFGSLVQWNLAGIFVFAVGFAIAGGVKILRSSKVEDFPNTRALLGKAGS